MDITPERWEAINARLVGFSDIAELLGLQRETVKRWHERREATNFPQVRVQVNNVYGFDRDEVLDWYRRWTSTRRVEYKKSGARLSY